MMTINQTINHQSLVDSLYHKNRMYQTTYDNLLSKNEELNRKLEELLICTHDIAKETEQLDHLIQFGHSPMQKVTFTKKGLLEGGPLERVQEQVYDMIIEQRSTITNLKDTLIHLNQQVVNIETEIEQNSLAMIEVEGSMSTNREEMTRLKMEIEQITNH